ncbi:MAG: flagellar export chaperone FlgN [Phycisphaeraceae bacterium]|nr:flagellar export chaperone FlgN [Phycisphaeraceae bacterium]
MIMPQPPASAAVAADAVDRLEDILDQLATHHQTLLDLARRQQAAIATADAPTLQRLVTLQNQAVQQIAALEHDRGMAVASIARATGRQPSALPAAASLSWLASGLDATARQRLSDAASRLMTILRSLRHEHEVIRAATTSLTTHMDGIIRQIARRLSHAGTYARHGGVDAGPTVQSALDMSL